MSVAPSGTTRIVPPREEVGRLKEVLKQTPFVRHPVAVLLSLALAILLVILIHQNLKNQEVWKGEVAVVTQAGEHGAELVIRVPPGYVARLPSPRMSTLLVLRGARKEKRPTRVVVEAFIPPQRLQDLGDEWRTVVLEDDDLDVPGYPSLTCEISPSVSIEVALLRPGKVLLHGVVVDENPDYDYAVEFKPSPLADVVAPAPFFGGRDQIEYTVSLKDRKEPQIIDAITIEGIKIPLDPPIEARVTSEVKPEAVQEFTLPGIRAYILRDYGQDEYEVTIKDLASSPTVTVTLKGPASAVRAAENPEVRAEMIKDLYVCYDVGPVIRANKDVIDGAGAQGWSTAIEGFVRHDLLEKYGLEDASAQLLTATIRRKP